MNEFYGAALSDFIAARDALDGSNLNDIIDSVNRNIPKIYTAAYVIDTARMHLVLTGFPTAIEYAADLNDIQKYYNDAGAQWRNVYNTMSQHNMRIRSMVGNINDIINYLEN